MVRSPYKSSGNRLSLRVSEAVYGGVANGLDQAFMSAYKHDVGGDEFVAFAIEAVVNAAAHGDGFTGAGRPPVAQFAPDMNPGREAEVA